MRFIVVYIRKRTVTPGTVCPGAIYHARAIYNPTNNAVPIKYRNQTPMQFPNLYSQYSLPKISPNNFPSWRRYTFLRVQLRNLRFLPHQQKNRSPLRTACTYFYINYYIYIYINVFVLKIVYAYVRICSGMAYIMRTKIIQSQNLIAKITPN